MTPVGALVRASLGSFILIFGVASWAGQQGPDSAASEPQRISLEELTNLSSPKLPVVYGASRELDALVKELSEGGRKSAEPPFGLEVPDSELGVCDDPGFIVASNRPESAKQRFSTLVARLGAIPFYPGICLRAVYVSSFESVSIVSGDGFPPTALLFAGDSLAMVSPARRPGGQMGYPGWLKQLAEKVDLQSGSVYVASKPRPWLTDEQRPFPSRQTFIAWDDNLKQFPPLPYDDFGSEPSGFWIQKNIDSLQGGGDSAVPCPHFVLQLSLVHPTSGLPLVLTERMTFPASANDHAAFTVSYDVVPADSFTGPLEPCRGFRTKSEILDATVGRYDRPRSGEDYLEASKKRSLSFLRSLGAVLSQAGEISVEVSPSLASVLEVVQSNEGDQEIPLDAWIEDLAGSPPGEYLSYLMSAR